ncbi:SDR family oxidoreductase [Rhodococcus sp. UNC363MFTsu5.1]|uniref:SDR family oxidoreductase n=1 Tax=Rhodococcus sp. UNC363MFTsu5.1 TaxID=1449069 RepID=UPI0004850F9B|nr:SDR family oxidoreductase [Rhodococcus sp. UNC363MFTsu5.1]
MKIVVIGGTGLIGSKLVARLNEQGHQAVPAAPSTGVNTLTGEGVREVLRDANVLIDVSNSPSFADDDVMTFFRTSTANLLGAAREAGVGHYVALSVVGTDRLPESGYLRAKVAQEELIKGSGLPYSLVHATQFFEFAGSIADSATTDGKVRLPGAGVQPIAAEEVAAAVGETAVGAPLNGTVEVAGPEVFGLDQWIRTVLAARHDPREVLTDPQARYFGAAPDRELLPGAGARLVQTRLSEWLTRQ